MATPSRILKHLTQTACPTCAAAIKSETFTGRVHCNGQQFESISFLCGCTIEWVPNFCRKQVATICPQAPESIAKERRRLQIGTAIWNAVTSFDLTDEEKTTINRFIQYKWR